MVTRQSEINQAAAKAQSGKLTVIVLAAGKGTRMKTLLPKVLHPVAGRPMIHRVLEACKGAGATDIRVIVGFQKELVRATVESLGVNCFDQHQQLGTADAVKAAQVDDIEGPVIILNGDHPLICAEDLQNALREFREQKGELAVLTCVVKKPGALGRIMRHKGEFVAIVEAKDARPEVLKVNEINTGIYITYGNLLSELLPLIRNQNQQKEYYLTDIVGLARERKNKVMAIKTRRRVAFGVNSQLELSQATQAVYLRNAKKLLDQGVMLPYPNLVWIEDEVTVGPGSLIQPNTYLMGKSKIGSHCVIEGNTTIRDCQIGDHVQIRSGCYFESSVVEQEAVLGPYTRLRPETVVGENAHIGNFVELKKVKFGKSSKAGHLTYLGDAEIGEDVNIGCGTITCNYAADRKKYKTIIGDRVFVGSDSQFVAPIIVGNDAVIGSGSVITENVPEGALAIARGRQVIKENYSAGRMSQKKDKGE